MKDWIRKLLDPEDDLYSGEGEYAERARNLRATYLSLCDLIDEVVPLRVRLHSIITRALGGGIKLTSDRQAVVKQAMQCQHDIVVELLEIRSMLGDPNLRWFMKGGGR